MVAAPQYGVFNFIGRASGRNYPVDAYFTDVNGALTRFDGGGGASTTSPEYWVAPGEPVTLRDFAIVTGMTDTSKIELTVNGRSTGGFLRYAMHLTTSALRPAQSITLRPGATLRAIQRT